MADIWINGAAMPPLKSLTISKNKIWSKNTDRAANGNMVGDIVAIKYKLQCTWGLLTDEQNAIIDAAVSNNFFQVRFRDPADSSGGLVTKTMYAGDPDYPVNSYSPLFKTYRGTSVNLIEK